jgi:hypothetical protein
MAPQAIGIAQNGLAHVAGSRSVWRASGEGRIPNGGDEVDKMEDKLGGSTKRAMRWRSDGPKAACQGLARTQRNETGLKPLITQETAKWLIRRPK